MKNKTLPNVVQEAVVFEHAKKRELRRMILGERLAMNIPVKRGGRPIWTADAHCRDGKRFVVRADEKLTAFVELESAMREEH